VILPPDIQVVAQEEVDWGCPEVEYTGGVTKVRYPVPEPNAVGPPTTPSTGASVDEKLLLAPQLTTAMPQPVGGVITPTSVIVPRPITNVN